MQAWKIFYLRSPISNFPVDKQEENWYTKVQINEVERLPALTAGFCSWPVDTNAFSVGSGFSERIGIVLLRGQTSVRALFFQLTGGGA